MNMEARHIWRVQYVCHDMAPEDTRLLNNHLYIGACYTGTAFQRTVPFQGPNGAHSTQHAWYNNQEGLSVTQACGMGIKSERLRQGKF